MSTQWMNFDSELQTRLGNEANLGVKTTTFDQYGIRGAGDGRTKGVIGQGVGPNINYYRNSNDWQKVASSLGIKNINSLNDLNSMFAFVNDGRYGSKKSGGGKEEEVKEDDGRYEPTANDPTARATTPGQEERWSNPESRVGEPQGFSGFDGRNLSSFYGRPDQFGQGDLLGAYRSGYSQQDVLAELSRIGPIQGDSGGYLAGSGVYAALMETSNGQISTKFADPVYSAYGTDLRRIAESRFGEADLLANRRAGFSDLELLDYLDANPNTLNERNKKGVQGGIYERLNAKRPQKLQEAIKPKSLLIGNSNLGNAGYADVIKPNRSSASTSTRSSLGTSQYNRSNFGNSKKSPISVTGLNI